MEITYSRAVHLGSQSEQITICDNVDYPDQVESKFNQLRAIACKALNVVPYESRKDKSIPFHSQDGLTSSAN